MLKMRASAFTLMLHVDIFDVNVKKQMRRCIGYMAEIFLSLAPLSIPALIFTHLSVISINNQLPTG